MKIAICEDEAAAREQLISLVNRVFAEMTYNFRCSSFSSGEKLIAFLKENPREFHIYLLDIELSGMDGLEVAQRIREQDPEAILFFVTSHGELMSEAFQVMALGYLTKPIQEEQVTKVLLSAIHLLESRRSLYFYKVRKKKHAVSLAQIDYIESRGRKVILHMSDGEERTHYGTLKEVEEQITSMIFARAHKSYFVNLEHIRSVDSWHILLSNGVELKISGTYHHAFNKAYRRFVLLKRKKE